LAITKNLEKYVPQIKPGTTTQDYEIERQMRTQFGYFAPTPPTAVISNTSMNQWQDQFRLIYNLQVHMCNRFFLKRANTIHADRRWIIISNSYKCIKWSFYSRLKFKQLLKRTGRIQYKPFSQT
jgi:hypothetical protein